MFNSIDLTLGVNYQASAILHALYGRDIQDNELHGLTYSVRSAAWYNGREHGISLSVRRGIRNEQLNIVFGEHRSCDNIFVDTWVSELLTNPPNIQNFEEKTYLDREMFGRMKIDEASDFIMKCIEIFCKETVD